MTAPTVNVAVRLFAADGTPLVGVVVSAKLDRDEIYQAFVVPRTAYATTDNTGAVDLALFPNAPAPQGLGTTGSKYTFSARVPATGATWRATAQIPNQDCNLHDVADRPLQAGLTDAQAAVVAAQGYAAAASAVVNGADFQTVVGIASAISTVAGDHTALQTVSGDHSAINTVAGDHALIVTVAADHTAINTVAGDHSAIATLAADHSAVVAVAADLGNINALAADLANVDICAVNINTLGAKLSLTKFGVVPDLNENDADDYSIMAAAIALADAGANPRRVWIPPTFGSGGMFRIGQRLQVPNHMTICGAGRTSVIGPKNGANCNLFENADQVNGNVGITFRDFVIDGNVAGQAALVNGTTNNFHGLYLYFIQDLRLADLEVRNCTGTGVETDGAGQVIGPDFVSNLWVHDNGFHGYMLTHSLRRNMLGNVLAEGNGSIGIFLDASEVDAVNLKALRNGGSALSAGIPYRSGINIRHVVAHTLANLTAEYNYGNGIEANGLRQCTGSNWRAQQNSQLTNNTYDDVAFGADPLLDGRGPTGWVTISGMLVGKDTQTSEGFATNKARYGLNVNAEIVDPLSITGFIAEGNITADLNLPADSRNVTINNVKRVTSAPTTVLDKTKGAFVGCLALNPTTGETWYCQDNSTGAAVWASSRSGGTDMRPVYVAGTWYDVPNYQYSAGAAQGNTKAKGILLALTQAITISDLAVRITTVAASSNVQLALYNANQTTLHPTTLVGNTANLSGASLANVSGPLVQGNRALTPGYYWLFGQTDSASLVGQGPNATQPYLGTVMGSPSVDDVSAGAAGALVAIGITNTFGAWPDFTGSALSYFSSAAAFLPTFKVASAP
jgi:hypothetical protein